MHGAIVIYRPGNCGNNEPPHWRFRFISLAEIAQRWETSSEKGGMDANEWRNPRRTLMISILRAGNPSSSFQARSSAGIATFSKRDNY